MTGQIGLSVFVAAVFAFHPLRDESVAWISERKDVLSTLFFMLGLWLTPGRSRRLAEKPSRWSVSGFCWD